MARQPQPLSAIEAQRRTYIITPLLAKDTWHALRIRAALHTANDVVSQKDFEGPSRFGDTYNVVQNSMALSVALALARLLDVSANRLPIEQQDKASIPVLAHLLKRHDVQGTLIEAARTWHPHLMGGAELGEATCREALSQALSLFEAHTASAEDQEAHARLRAFRTGRLAHHLFDALPQDLPRFEDLDALADFARSFVRQAVLAVEGHDRDLSCEEQIKMTMNKEFWATALSATLRAEQGSAE